jgi:glutaminyl-tRNA synthetase
MMVGTDATMSAATGAGMSGSEGSPETPSAPAPGRDRKNVAKKAREAARATDPELGDRFARYRDDLGLSEGDADILSGSSSLAGFFEGALEAEAGPEPVAVANWVVNEVVGALKGRELAEVSLEPGQLGTLVALVDGGTISQSVAKDLLEELLEKGGDPAQLVRERGLEKVGDVDALKPLVDKVLADNIEKVQEYRDGKKGLLGFFMGEIMKATGGTSDPGVVRDLLQKVLDQETS